MGPSREELRLRSDFCIRDPHHERAEVFGSQKRKPDTPIGADDETHRPDRVVNASVRPSHVSVRPCQLDMPLVRPTSIRVTTR